jgi:hypothetical protein
MRCYRLDEARIVLESYDREPFAALDHLFVADHDMAAIGRFKPSDTAQHRRFPTSRGAEQRVELSGLHGEVHTPHPPHRSLGGLIHHI